MRPRLPYCLRCETALTKKGQVKFCSLECSNLYGKGRSKFVRGNWVDDFMKSLMKDYLSKPAPQSVCKHFGCGKHLSATDLMYSPYCRDHQNTKQVDVTFIIKNK